MAQARDEAGNIWEVDAQGNAVRLIRAAGAAPQMPADPTFPYQGAKAAAEVDNTQANARVNTVQANVAEATAPAVIAKTNAEADKAAAEAARIERERAAGRPTLSPEAYATAMAQASGARGLTAIIKDLEDKYKAGPGGTSGLRGLRDYFPGESNERFDTAANSARGTVAKALGFTGGQLNSAVEAKFNLGSYIPQSDNFDGTIEDTIARLKQLQQDAFKGAVATLGGVPDANGRITPIPEGVPLNAMTIPRLVAGEKLTAAEFGATSAVKPLPPEVQQAHGELVRRLIAEGGGRIDPQAYVQGRAALLANVPGFQDNDPQANAAWAERLNTYFEQGGKTVPGDISAQEQELSTLDWGRNALVNNPAGAAAVGYADMMGMGGVTALAPEQTAMLADARPLASAIGNIGGAIGGTSLIGKGIGATVGGAITPRMSAYGRMKLGRNGVTLGKEVGTDALYSAIYGGVTGQDPLEAAAWGAGGTLMGRGVGKVVGGVVGGVKASPAVEALRARGIPLTGGQALGGIAKGIEDRATSIPIVGDIINTRRMDGLEAFNREAMKDAGAPIGYAPGNIGKEGVQELFDEVGNSYDNATAGVRVPLDDEFMADIARARAAGQQLPPDLQVRFDKAMQNRVDPLMDPPHLRYSDAAPPVPSLNDNSNLPGAMGSLADFLGDPRPLSAMYEVDDLLTHRGAVGRVRSANPETVAVEFADGTRIIPRTDPDLGVAPFPLPPQPMSGEQYQQAVRGLKSYKAEATKPGFEQDYREALNGPINALRSAMTRGGGESVVEGLGKADNAYRNIKIVQDATNRADGAGYMFTPSQLQDAAKASARKYPGSRELYDFADTAQEVLPSSVPNSFTTDRAAQLAMGGGLLTGGTALGGTFGAASGDGQNVGSDAASGAAAGGLSSLALLSALAMGGTKRGQKAIVSAMLDRPEALKTAGAYINTRRGLFGRAALPFVLSPAYTE